MNFNPLNVLSHIRTKVLEHWPDIDDFTNISVEESIFAEDIFNTLKARMNNQLLVVDDFCVTTDEITKEDGDDLDNDKSEINHNGFRDNDNDNDEAEDEEDDEDDCQVIDEISPISGNTNSSNGKEHCPTTTSDQEILKDQSNSMTDNHYHQETRRVTGSPDNHNRTIGGGGNNNSITNGYESFVSAVDQSTSNGKDYVSAKESPIGLTNVQNMDPYELARRTCRWCGKVFSAKSCRTRHEKINCRAPGSPSHVCRPNRCRPNCMGKGVFIPDEDDIWKCPTTL